MWLLAPAPAQFSRILFRRATLLDGFALATDPSYLCLRCDAGGKHLFQPNLWQTAVNSFDYESNKLAWHSFGTHQGPQDLVLVDRHTGSSLCYTAQIHRDAVAHKAVYGRVDAMTKAAREADLAPKSGEWVSPFCRREYQDFWPEALSNPAFDPICKRQVEAFLAHCKQDAKDWSASWDKTTGKHLHNQDPACVQ
jgi:hypothetical protein